MWSWLPKKRPPEDPPLVLTDIPVTIENTSHIQIVDDTKSPPHEQRRKYIANLTDNRSMEVERFNGGYTTRTTNIMLYESADEYGIKRKWLIIHMDRIPANLLHPEIVPLIKAHYKEIVDLDEEWVKNGLKEFTDKNGNKWVKVTK
jgi:hypothetical protein